MRARVAALVVAVLTVGGLLATFVSGPAKAAPFPGGAAFSGYATGTAVHADVLQVEGAPRLLDGEIAFSGGATDTAGLASPIQNEMSLPVSRALAGKNSYGRGSGLELGIGTENPDPDGADPNQAIIAGLAEQAAAPVDSFGATPLADGRVRTEVGPVPGGPLIWASLLRGEGAARWNPNSCILGAPLQYGLGYAADAQLINTAGEDLDPENPANAPLVATDTNPNGEDVVQSKSFTYLRPQPDGTFAVVSEVRQELAPVTLFKNMAGAELHIDIGGEWYMRTISTGKPGGSFVEYGTTAVEDPNTHAVITITPPDSPAAQQIIALEDLFNADAIPTQIPLGSGGQYLAIINVAEPPRAIGSDDVEDPPGPQKSQDGTVTAAAMDAVRIQLVIPAVGEHIAEVRVGHMETKSVAPVGGVECPIPVSKTANPDPVNAGQDFTWTISIPKDVASLAGTDCELTNIKATDVARVLSGSPSAIIKTASDGGVINGNTVSPGKTASITWENLGNYKPGDQPKTITISGSIPATSGAGVLQNTVTVTATLGNCKGGAAGNAIVGNATVQGTANLVGAAVKGTAFVDGPKVNGAAVQPARLAETGQREPWLPVAGGGLLLGALALMRSRRRLRGEEA